ncbi:hypothetical protein OIU76_001220 [Salix suchowensis]|nr:hypothetical protein OIU76_001220 [Salix suchowensis]
MFFCRKNFCSVFQPSDFERLYRSCANCCVCLLGCGVLIWFVMPVLSCFFLLFL